MNATSGPTSARQFAFYDPDTSSWRMWPDTGLWGSIEFSETWPRTGCMSGGRAFELPTLVPRITGNACSSSPSLPTPTATPYGSNQSASPGAAVRPSLESVDHHFPTPRASDPANTSSHSSEGFRPQLGEVARTLLPTPVVTDAAGARNATANRSNPNSKHHSGTTLTDAVTVLPTPRARDGKGKPSPGFNKGNLPTVAEVFSTPKASDATGGGQHPSKRVGHTLQLIDQVLSIGDSTDPLFDVGSD